MPILAAGTHSTENWQSRPTQVTGRVLDSSVKNGKAKALLEFEGTSAAMVKEMFLTQPANKFFPGARSWMSFTYARCGQKERALAGLEDLQSRSGTEYVDPVLVSTIQLGLGDLEGAIRQAFAPGDELLKAIEAYGPSMTPFLDGASSERVLDAAEDMIQSGWKDSKPANLWRNFKMRQRLQYKKT